MKVKANGRTGIKIFRMKPKEKIKEVQAHMGLKMSLTTSDSTVSGGEGWGAQRDGHKQFLSLKITKAINI